MLSQEFITQNFPQGKVTIIGGHPANGKSSLATSLVLSLASYGKKSIFFSLEMNKDSLIRRMKMQVGYEKFASIDEMITIKDPKSVKLDEIKEQLVEKNTDYVFIDSLQIIDLEFNGLRPGEYAYVINTLIQWSEEFHVTIIAISSMRRIWVRGAPRPKEWGKRPLLSYLAGISPDALNGVNVKLIHRPYYYVKIEKKGSKKIINEKIEIITYKGTECIVSSLIFNSETTEMATSYNELRNINQKEWKRELKKAAHRYGMQTIMHPFAHKDAVEDISNMFIAGANFFRKV